MMKYLQDKSNYYNLTESIPFAKNKVFTKNTASYVLLYTKLCECLSNQIEFNLLFRVTNE